MKKVILIWISMMIFMYFGISFINLEMNPILWTKDARFAFFLFSIFDLVLSFMITELIKLDKK